MMETDSSSVTAAQYFFLEEALTVAFKHCIHTVELQSKWV